MTVDVIRMATNPVTKLPYLTPEVDIQVAFEDDREEPLDDWWTMVTGSPPLQQSQLEPGCYDNVILPLAGSSSPFWTLLLQNNNDQICTKKS